MIFERWGSTLYVSAAHERSVLWYVSSWRWCVNWQSIKKVMQKSKASGLVPYIWQNLAAAQLFFLSRVLGFFSFFHSGSSDSMCAFLLCYWLCCKESSEQNWFMIHFAAIQTASSEVTKKFCFCTHLINETQRKTRQNRTPTWSSGVRSQAHFAKSREVTCSRFSYLIICLFFCISKVRIFPLRNRVKEEHIYKHRSMCGNGLKV